MGVLSDEDLVVMRTRARHRMLGVLGLVVAMVVGVPLLLDHQEPVSPSVDEPAAAATVPPAGPPLVTTVPATALAGGPAGTPASATLQPATSQPAASAIAAPAAPDQAVKSSAAPAAASVAANTPSVIPALSTSPHGKAETSDTAPAAHSKNVAAEAAHGKNASTGLTDVGAEGPAQRGWYVQFGVFAEAPRAESVVTRLAGNKVVARSELIHGPRGNFTRVRSGPFSTRARADEVLARVKALGENAILVHQ